LGFVLLRTYSFVQTGRQQKIIVYNVPQKTAIDLIEGHRYYFTGDASVQQDDFIRNFHLKPSRILYRAGPVSRPDHYFIPGSYINYYDKHIVWVNEPVSLGEPGPKRSIDLLILSNNPRIYLRDWIASLTIQQVVVDGSVPAWKARYWKKDCDSLGIPYHDVSTQGAFVMNLR
jgi:competence protein ComEC